MKEPITLTYKEIDTDELEAILKCDGMVFVRVSAWQGKAFLALCKRSDVIEKYKWKRPGWPIRLLNLSSSITTILYVFVFHMRLIELDAFKTLSDVRCTYEIQPNGEYVLIFS